MDSKWYKNNIVRGKVMNKKRRWRETVGMDLLWMYMIWQNIFVVPDLELVVALTSHYEGSSSVYWQIMNNIVNACVYRQYKPIIG